MADDDEPIDLLYDVLYREVEDTTASSPDEEIERINMMTWRASGSRHAPACKAFLYPGIGECSCGARRSLDGPASGATVAVDERSTERATAESTGVYPTAIHYDAAPQTMDDYLKRNDISTRLQTVKQALRDGTLNATNAEHHAQWDDVEYLYESYTLVSLALQAEKRVSQEHWDHYEKANAERDQWKHLSGEAAKGLALADKRVTLLRAALVGLVGVDTRAELEELEAAMRLMPAPAQDKAATIDAIHALVATLPE